MPTKKQPSIHESKLSVISVQCRICYDNDKDEPLIAPCQCKGTVAFVHCSCLERWLGESNTTTCELCHQIFRTERTPKESAGKSIWKWLRFGQQQALHNRGGVRSDMIACTIVTPLAIILTYICLFSADYYNQKRFDQIPAAHWTSVSLLIMIVIMLIGYYIWVYSTIRLHSRMWYNWWQRDCVVRYIPNGAISLMYSPENSPPNNTPASEENGNNGDVVINIEEEEEQEAETEESPETITATTTV